MALGVVLTPYGKLPNGAPPYGIAYAFKGATRWQQGVADPAFDPQFNSRGEPGWYYDTPLGGSPSLWQRMKRRLNGLGNIPTDAELATVSGTHGHMYTPVESGWIPTNRGMQTGPWLPPSGWPFYAPRAPLGLMGFRDAAPAATVEDVMLTLQAHNDRVFALALVSTSAVAISALIGLFRTLKLIRAEK